MEETLPRPAPRRACPLSEVEVRALADRAGTGDREAFGRLFDAYREDLLAFARRRLPQPEDAEDVLQQTFFKALRAIGARDGSRPFNAWLFRIAANTITDFYRTRKQDAELEGDAGGAEPSAEEQALEGHFEPRVETAFASLTARQRWVIRLRIFEGLEYEEIAQRLNCTPGAARAVQMRAIHTLRDILGGEEAGAERTSA